MPHTSWTHWDKSRETRYQENSIQRRIQKALPYDTKSLGPLLCSLVHIGAPWTLWKKMCPGTSSRGVSAGVPLAGRLCKTDSPMGLVLSLSVWQRTLLVQFPFNLFFPVCLALSKLCLFDVVPIYLPYQLSDPLQKSKSHFPLVGIHFVPALLQKQKMEGVRLIHQGIPQEAVTGFTGLGVLALAVSLAPFLSCCGSSWSFQLSTCPSISPL